MRRLVFTSALGPGYRPTPAGEGFPFSAIVTIEAHEGGTKYSVVARHADPESAAKHAEMGFVDGWNAAFDQLVEAIAAGEIG